MILKERWSYYPVDILARFHCTGKWVCFGSHVEAKQTINLRNITHPAHPVANELTFFHLLYRFEWISSSIRVASCHFTVLKSRLHPGKKDQSFKRWVSIFAAIKIHWKLQICWAHGENAITVVGNL